MYTASGAGILAWTVYENDSYNLYGLLLAADGSSDGDVFLINTEVNGYTHTPTLMRLSNGKIAAVWTGTGGTDTSLEGIQARLFGDDNLPTGSQFTINSYVTSPQKEPAAAPLAGGGLVAAWKSPGYGDDDFSTGVYGRVMGSDGSAVCSEFQVNTYTGGRSSALFGPQESQEGPAAGGLSNGDFIIAWESYQDGDGWGVYGRRFSSDCQKKGVEFRINTSTTGDQILPRIAALAGGGFVVAWQSNHNSGVSGFDSMAQIHTDDGVRVGGEFSLSESVDGTQATPFVVALSDGGFVGVWETSGTDGGSGYGLAGRVFSADGTPVSDDFQINIETSGDEDEPRAAPLDSGGFIVAWQHFSGWETQKYGLVTQRFGNVSSTPGAGLAWRMESNRTGGTVSFKVGGFDITHYRYSLDSGNWSDDTGVSQELALSGVTTGSHLLSVLGRNSTGGMQAEGDALELSFCMEDGAVPQVEDDDPVVPALGRFGVGIAAVLLIAAGGVLLGRKRPAPEMRK